MFLTRAASTAQGIYSPAFFPSFLGWRTMCTRQGLLGSRIQIEGRLAQSPTRESASNWKFIFFFGGEGGKTPGNRNDRVRASPFLGGVRDQTKGVGEPAGAYLSTIEVRRHVFGGEGWPRGMGERG